MRCSNHPLYSAKDLAAAYAPCMDKPAVSGILLNFLSDFTGMSPDAFLELAGDARKEGNGHDA